MHDQLDKVPQARLMVEIERRELIDAWSLVECLTVSLDQIGGACRTEEEATSALRDFITPELIATLSKVRSRLGRYIPEEEAIALSDNEVPYWDYKGMKKGKYLGAAEE